MFKALLLNLLLFAFCENGFCKDEQKTVYQPVGNKAFVDSLNNHAYNSRLSNPQQTIEFANQAFLAAKKINYFKGEGEACRIIGIGHYYLSGYELALDKYLEAITYFELANYQKGVGKVYNNIGNLYLLNDYDKALTYYNKSLTIAKSFHAVPEIAGLYVNIGVIEMKKKKFNDALQKFEISMSLFKKLDAPILIIQCMQNIGEAYNYLKHYQQAEDILKSAVAKAEALNLNYTIASIKLTLTNVYISQNKFGLAEATLKDGLKHAKTLNNRDLQNDYNYSHYQLEYKKKNYVAALQFLKQNFSQDSAYYRQSFSNRITLASDLFNQLENRRKNERIIAQQKYTSILFGASTVVAGLLAAIVFLLYFYAKRTNKSNQELTVLHTEVSRQKEDLDRINHHLEEIIDERTSDLKVKNKTLSDYSLHLSHQIRGPIATLKGIVYLQETGLIDQQECTNLIRKCVSDIDDEIISMSKLLNENTDREKN